MNELIQAQEQNTEQSSANASQIVSQFSENSLETQNRKLNPNFTADGKFAPGNCANPGGRPKSRLISEELREILRSEDASTKTGAERLGNKLMGHAEQDKDGYLSLAAIKEITDRVEGKAVQTSNVRGLFVMMPAQAVIAEAFDCPEPEESDI